MATLAAFLAVLGYKMVFYTVVLLGVGAWGARQKKRATLAEADATAAATERDDARATLITMSIAVGTWRAKANAAAAAANSAQLEAADLRNQYEGKAMALSVAPVPDAGAMAFLRDQAEKTSTDEAPK